MVLLPWVVVVRPCCCRRGGGTDWEGRGAPSCGLVRQFVRPSSLGRVGALCRVGASGATVVRQRGLLGTGLVDLIAPPVVVAAPPVGLVAPPAPVAPAVKPHLHRQLVEQRSRRGRRLDQHRRLYLVVAGAGAAGLVVGVEVGRLSQRQNRRRGRGQHQRQQLGQKQLGLTPPAAELREAVGAVRRRHQGVC